MAICLNCKKEYIPKRRGGKFCSTSCRVSYWEKVQRGHAIANPPSTKEVHLAEKLAIVAGLARSLNEERSLPKEQRQQSLSVQLDAFLKYCISLSGDGVIEDVQLRDKLQNSANLRASRKEKKEL